MDYSAKLLYLYVDRSDFGIKKVGINFSSDYDIKFEIIEDKENFSINRKKDCDVSFFHEKISNITMLVGKNGVGKSSLMKLIGFGEENRKKFLPKNIYFVLYKVNDSIFFIEGSNSLLKKVFHEDSKITKNRYFFKMIKGKPIILRDEFQNELFLESSYQANIPKLEWVEEHILRKEKNDYPVWKSIYPSVNFQNLIDFINKHDRSNVKNVQLTLKQNKRYSSNLMILFSIYELDSEDLKFFFNKRYPKEKNLPQKIFTTEINFLLKEMYDEKYEDTEIVYKRSLQDKIYGNNKKYYFLLRFLEKEAISFFNNLTISDYSQIENIFRKIAKARNYKILDVFSTDIDIKISFLVNLLSGFKNEDENRHNTYETIDVFVDFFSKYVEDEYIGSNNELSFDLKDNNEYNISSKLISDFNNFFQPKIKQLSDGQLVYFNTFSKIFTYLSRNSEQVPLLLLLDEPDLNLHPEWSRRFIYDLIELIKSVDNERKIQVIITSHSPFMVTDLPKENVYIITDKSKIENVPISFAANIYDLLLDSFFLDSSIGEFAKFKIKEKSSKQKNIVAQIDDPFLKKILKEDRVQ